MRRVCRLTIIAIVLMLCRQKFAPAQTTWEYGGYAEGAATIYPRRPRPPDTHSAAASHFQLWSRLALGPRLSWRTTMDFRLDTHRDIDRNRWFDLSQRSLQQPAGALSEFYGDLKLGRLDLRLGKQEIRWGRADGFNPTDNLNPYDYLNTFSDQRIAVPAVKADTYLGGARFEVIWLPFYTPTRLPLLGQRWFPRLPGTARIPIIPGAEATEADLYYCNGDRHYPARTFGNSQWAIRWNQLVPRVEFSISYFDGFDDLPFLNPSASLLLPPSGVRSSLLVSLNREYYRVKIAGADLATQFGSFGVRGEMAYFNQTDPITPDHLLFVVGLDRTYGDWFVILQYAGQKMSGRIDNPVVFPDLAFRSTLLCRVERAIGPSRNLEVKLGLRLLDGDFFLQPLYSVALSPRWRLKAGLTVFGGAIDSYLGQFRDNANLNLQLRYSF